MKLKNKKTGHIIECSVICSDENLSPRLIESNEGRPITLTELNEEWEDCEEPKEYWYIDYDGGILCGESDNSSAERMMKNMGNYFESMEEAEKAVRKLEAWKVLKDMGFKIEGIRYRNNKSYIEWSISQKTRDDHFMSEAFNEALHLLFGGEE